MTPVPEPRVLEMFKMIRDILDVALMPGGDARAIVAAQDFLDHLLKGDPNASTETKEDR